MSPAKKKNDSCYQKPKTPNRTANHPGAKYKKEQNGQTVEVAEKVHIVIWLWESVI